MFQYSTFPSFYSKQAFGGSSGWIAKSTRRRSHIEIVDWEKEHIAIQSTCGFADSLHWHYFTKFKHHVVHCRTEHQCSAHGFLRYRHPERIVPRLCLLVGMVHQRQCTSHDLRTAQCRYLTNSLVDFHFFHFCHFLFYMYFLFVYFRRRIRAAFTTTKKRLKPIVS